MVRVNKPVLLPHHFSVNLNCRVIQDLLVRMEHKVRLDREDLLEKTYAPNIITQP